MNWDDTRYFLAIAREGQMLGAANRLGVSQTRLSRHLQALEEALNARLFDRSTRGCTLTDDGRVFLATAERIEAEVLSGMSKLRGSAERVEGTMRIAAPDGFTATFLARHLGEIASELPGLRIQMVPLNRNFSLSEREADLAVMVGRPERGRLRTKRLTDYTLGLYAARDYLDRAGRPSHPAALLDHRLVGYVEDLLVTPELNYADEFAPGWRSHIEISTAVGQFEAVRAGAGIGVLHDFMATKFPELERVFPQLVTRRSYWAVWHENLHSSRKLRAVLGILERIVERDRAVFCLPE